MEYVTVEEIMKMLKGNIQACEKEIKEIKKGGIWNIPEDQVEIEIARLQGRIQQARMVLDHVDFLEEARKKFYGGK